MGLGPVLSATELLKRNKLSLGDIETWELNEAFATQVLGCLAAWNDDKFCREILGLDGAAGQIDRAKLNVDGGAISLGHPVGCSGNRIVLHLVNAMKRLGTKRGIATECIGGGQGGAMLIEMVGSWTRRSWTFWRSGARTRAEARGRSALSQFQADPRWRRHCLAAVRPRRSQRQHAVGRCHRGIRHGAGGAGKPAAGGPCHSLGEDHPASSPAPTSTNFAAPPIPVRSRPRSAGRMR